jgi:CBS domain-containing protein
VRISDVLRGKGDDVVTIVPEATVTDLLARLAEHKVGALVVSRDGTAVEGIVSERDVVRHLFRRGGALLEDTVSSIMTSEVRTCRPADGTDDLMRTMTTYRHRHVPVVDDGRLVGIVSIGDVVKHRIDELESERDHLTAYITGQ